MAMRTFTTPTLTELEKHGRDTALIVASVNIHFAMVECVCIMGVVLIIRWCYVHVIRLAKGSLQNTKM